MFSILILIVFLIGIGVLVEWMLLDGGIRVVLIDENGKMLRGFLGDYEI